MAPSKRTRLAAVLAVPLLSAGFAHAQIPTPSQQGASFSVGKVLLYPAFVARFEGTDNIFLRSDDDPENVKSTTITTASAGCVAELPFSHSYARVGYGLRHRVYGAKDLDSSTNHHFLAETRLAFGNGFVLEARDEYQRGVIDTTVFDEALEVTFAGERFALNNLGVRVGLERGIRRRIYLALNRDRNSVLGERLSGIPDWSRSWLRLSGDEQLSRSVWLLAGLDRGDATYTRFDETDQQAGDNSWEAWVARAGIRVALGPTSTLRAVGGWAEYDFRSRLDSSFAGVVGSVEFERWSPNQRRWSAGIVREVYPTLTDTSSNYLVSRQLRLGVQSSARASIVWGGAASYYVNRYPEPTSERSDRVAYLDIWGGYRFGEFAECRLTIGRSSRDSEAAVLNYEENRIQVDLRFGG